MDPSLVVICKCGMYAALIFNVLSIDMLQD